MIILNVTEDPEVVAFRKRLLFAQYSQKRCKTSYCPRSGPPIQPRLPRFISLPSFKYDDDEDDEEEKTLTPVHENLLFDFMNERRKELEESPNYQELLLEQEKRSREFRENRLRRVRRLLHPPHMTKMMKMNGDDQALLEKVKTDEVELEKVTKVDGDGASLKKCKLNDVEDALADADEMMSVDVDLNLMGAGLLKPCAAARNASHSKPQ